MVIDKDTYIKLVRFDVTKEHQITFSDGVSQVDYFLNQINGVELTASSYQRKEYKIRFPALIDSIEQYNYAIVQNKPESYKYYFYYITDMEYISDELTDVTIKLDVFQTYQFDFHYLRSLVEREHANTDNVGDNTIPEGIEKGFFTLNKKEQVEELNRIVYVVQVKKIEDGTTAISTNLGGIQGKGGYYVCRYYKNVLQIINEYASTEQYTDVTIEDIESIYMIPYAFTNFNFDSAYVDQPDGWIRQLGRNSEFGEMTFPNRFDVSINKPNSIDGYIPKNKKLLTREFNYLIVSNQNGATEELAYEDFNTSDCQFEVAGIPVQGGSGLIIPIKYGHRYSVGDILYYDDIYSLPAGKYPVTDFYYDSFKYWLQMNSFNIQTGAIESGIESIAGAVQLGVGAYSGDVGGIISGGTRTLGIFGYAFNLYKEMNNKKKIPPASISQSCNGNVLTALRENSFAFYHYSIQREYAEIIDNYFSNFGYKTLKTKVPNITGRSNWNYVKTIEANVDSTTVPEKYINEFKQMLNNGITFWHNPATFMDYSQTNSIV